MTGAVRGGFGGIGSSTNLGAGVRGVAGSIVVGAAAAGGSAVGKADSRGALVSEAGLAGIRSSAICATRARNWLAWGGGVVAAGAVATGGSAAEGVPDSMSGAVVPGGHSGAANSTNVGGGEGSAAAGSAVWTTGG